MNEIAPAGQTFVCAACGKQSKDRYGEMKISSGWDESCMLNAVLCYDEKHPAVDGTLMWTAVKGNDQ